ncbi:hypothetical protein [Kineobactrum salinum]|uniref:Uncharacterized protein n=1 Tax=Kineobactrum salinum TaxID=2708301 RepID=A0A6C0TXI8_9GAMM|nr:hypothetical protein [Kineobactrum salinum]QIB64348.1 hypothetical protein G3T16_01930 [Kineobactrum salinum]
MSIRFLRRRRRSLSKLAWGLIPLALIVATLLLLRPSGSDDGSADISLVASYPDAELWAVNPGLRPGAAGQEFVAPNSARRNRVLQRLGQFRADYRQSAPFLTISHSAGSPARRQFARELAGVLAQHDLGAAGAGPAPAEAEREADIIVRAARRDQNIVRALLQALSPYYSAHVLLLFDESIRLDRLSLHIAGDPTFTREGLAIFPR